MNKTLDHARFSVAYYSGNRKTGTLTRVRCEGGEVMVTPLPTEPESALDKPLKPVLVGMSEDGRVILLDPRSKQIRFETRFPADAFPAHIYQDPQSTRAWFMNAGDRDRPHRQQPRAIRENHLRGTRPSPGRLHLPLATGPAGAAPRLYQQPQRRHRLRARQRPE